MRFVLWTIIILFFCSVSFGDDNVEEIIGTINKIKTDKPYPFPRRVGVTWECKIRVSYIEEDPDGEQEIEVYKAYPVNRGDRWMCKLPKKTQIKMTVMSKGEYRGEILRLEVLK